MRKMTVGGLLIGVTALLANLFLAILIGVTALVPRHLDVPDYVDQAIRSMCQAAAQQGTHCTSYDTIDNAEVYMVTIHTDKGDTSLQLTFQDGKLTGVQ